MNDKHSAVLPETELHEETASEEAEEFYPKGAIAFFSSLIIGFGLIWAGLFYLMVHRQFHP